MTGHDFALNDARVEGLALLQAAGPGLRISVPFSFSMHRELVHNGLDGPGFAPPEGLKIVMVPPR
jgi:NitT/TauT family transport system ATP-binding protein